MRDWDVCFDLGGVFARIAPSWNQALGWSGLASYQRPDLEARCFSFAAYTVHEVGGLSDAAYFAELQAYLRLPTPGLARRAHLGILGPGYEGGVGLVASLRAEGYRTGCLSNTEALHWEKMVGGYYPAISAIEHLQASHLLGARKPHREIFEAFQRATGFRRDATLYFDDSPAHVEGAREFGWTAHTVDPLGDPVAQMRSALASEGVLVSR